MIEEGIKVSARPILVLTCFDIHSKIIGILRGFRGHLRVLKDRYKNVFKVSFQVVPGQSNGRLKMTESETLQVWISKNTHDLKTLVL